MIGVDRITGKTIAGSDHLAQSFADILSTPIGTRTMLRDYGSLLPGLIDAPMNRATQLLHFAAIATALARWEQRLRITRILAAAMTAHGAMSVTIEGERTDLPPANSLVTLQIPLAF